MEVDAKIKGSLDDEGTQDEDEGASSSSSSIHTNSFLDIGAALATASVAGPIAVDQPIMTSTSSSISTILSFVERYGHFHRLADEYSCYELKICEIIIPHLSYKIICR